MCFSRESVFRRVFLVTLSLSLLLVPFAEGGQRSGIEASLSPLRQLQPVDLLGAQIPSLFGVPIAHVWAYRYSAADQSFEQIPLQVDEVALYDLTHGGGSPVYETTLDWNGVENGVIDSDDQIVFMARDGGDRVLDAQDWVAGADSTRWEIRISDPAGGEAYVYLYTSSTIEDDDPDFQYVEYVEGSPSSGVASVETETYALGYEGRWRVTDMRATGGPDVLDRVKVRVFGLRGGETEENFETSSSMLGTIGGKVRVTREVQGAESGILTTHVDQFYRDTWHRVVNLRVHSLTDLWYYEDYLPQTGAAKFYSAFPQATGITLDGVNDAVPQTLGLPSWTQASLPGGTFVTCQQALTLFPQPDPGASCVPNAGAHLYWRDDAAFDDLTGVDRKAIGNNGLRLTCLGETNSSAYSLNWEHYFLPPQAPPAPVGQDYSAIEQAPLHATITPQARASLTDCLIEDGDHHDDDGQISFYWSGALGQDSFEIYRGMLQTPFALQHDVALACGLPSDLTEWTTPGDEVSGQPSTYYLVVPRQGSQRAYGMNSFGVPRPPSSSQCP